MQKAQHTQRKIPSCVYSIKSIMESQILHGSKAGKELDGFKPQQNFIFSELIHLHKAAPRSAASMSSRAPPRKRENQYYAIKNISSK